MNLYQITIRNARGRLVYSATVESDDPSRAANPEKWRHYFARNVCGRWHEDMYNPEEGVMVVLPLFGTKPYGSITVTPWTLAQERTEGGRQLANGGDQLALT